MFYDIKGEKYRSILNEENGEWLIAYENIKAPFFVTETELVNYTKIETPVEVIQNMTKNLSLAEQKRKDWISELIENTNYICMKNLRNEKVKEIAERFHIKEQRIKNIYYLYLATGGVSRKRKEKEKIRSKELEEKYKNFDWAIKKYYYSAKQMSLEMTYDMMLMNLYSYDDGTIDKDIPSFSSFKHYFYRNCYHKNKRKEISRNGLSDFKRNSRPIFGSAMKWKDKIGYYQMDATIADIYLVSRYNRNTIVGRPNIYLAVDSVSQLIAGIYIGFESNKKAVLSCLANAAEDKVKFCKKYKIDIKKEQWPSYHLAGGIITDQGKEFTYGVDELCKIYGMEIEALPPFRPDEKSLVEKTFDLINNQFKHFLKKRGVIEKDSGNRWATDYRKQAVLNLYEFTQIIIYCVLYINSIRIIDSYMPPSNTVSDDFTCTASNIWKLYLEQNKTALIPIQEQQIYLMSLDRKQVSISRKGILHNGILYKNINIMELLAKVKNKVTIAYDKDNIQFIYMIYENEYIPFEMAEHFDTFSNLTYPEYMDAKKQIQKTKLENKEQKIALLKNMKDVIKKAEIETSKERNGNYEI